MLDRFNMVSDGILGIATGRMISGKSLLNMKVIEMIITDAKDLKDSTAPSQTIGDFPSILKEDNPEAIAGYLAAYTRESEKATKTVEVALARKQKTAKPEATNYDSVAAPKRKRGKGDSHVTKTTTKLAWDEIEADEAAGIVKPPKKHKAGEEMIISPMYTVTPEEAKRNQDYYENLKNERKRLKAQQRIDREKRIKEMGLENCDQSTIEDIIEVQNMTRQVEEETLKKAKKAMKETLGTSVPVEAILEAAASEAAPTEAAKISKVVKTLVPPVTPYF